jgi:hypothetical protein
MADEGNPGDRVAGDARHQGARSSIGDIKII